jgi:hypothetical protein
LISVKAADRVQTRVASVAFERGDNAGAGRLYRAFLADVPDVPVAKSMLDVCVPMRETPVAVGA